MKNILAILLALGLSINSYAQIVEGGASSFRTVLNAAGKFATTTKISYLSNPNPQDLNISAITGVRKDVYSGGTFTFNNLLARKNLGTIYSTAALFDIKYKGTTKPFTGKRYVWTLIVDTNSGQIYQAFRYNDGKKINFGKLLQSAQRSGEHGREDLTISSPEAIGEYLKLD